MTRHLADHRKPSQGARLREFVMLDRAQGKEGSHPASVSLLQRPKGLAETNRRLTEFLRIARGREA